MTVVLDRLEHRLMRVQDPHGMFFEAVFRTAEERDTIALVLRDLAGDSFELRNTPPYQAGYVAPQDAAFEEEEEEDEM